MSKELKKNIVIIIILIVIAMVSIFYITPIAKSNEFHKKTIESLDKKKITVAEITAGCAATSMGLSAIPGDATTPVADKIMDLSSYLLIVVVVILLEKIMLNLTGVATFAILIPASCALLAIYLLAKNEVIKKLAIKLATFGIILFATVPLSVQVSNIIEKSYEENLNNIKKQKVVAEAKKVQENNEIKVETEGDGVFSKIKDGFKEVGEGVTNVVEKGKQEGKQALSNVIDGIAILLITSCVIPIAVLMFLLWIVKIIFNVNIQVQNPKKFFKGKNETAVAEEKNN